MKLKLRRQTPRPAPPAPAFILGEATVTLGEEKRFTMRLQHKRDAFLPTKLYVHLEQPKTFTLEKVQWGQCKEEQIICPVDLSYFGMATYSVALALPRLSGRESISMKVLYTGQVMPGLKAGNPFKLTIVWAEAGASLLRSENITSEYSIE